MDIKVYEDKMEKTLSNLQDVRTRIFWIKFRWIIMGHHLLCRA